MHPSKAARKRTTNKGSCGDRRTGGANRRYLQQLSIKAIKDCIQVIQSLIFVKFFANSAAPWAAELAVKIMQKSARKEEQAPMDGSPVSS
jgi:hypothetical protein